MSVIHFRRRELTARIVYVGPPGSGKTTNLQHLYTALPESHRGELVLLAAEGDQTLFFDYAPEYLANIDGFKAHFQLVTIPGELKTWESYRTLLRGADGVVFVVDSTPEALTQNKELLTTLRHTLRELVPEQGEVPIIFQLNKRDLPKVVSVTDLVETLGITDAEVVEAAALQDRGVDTTIQTALHVVLSNMYQETWTNARARGLLGEESTRPEVTTQGDEVMCIQAMVGLWRKMHPGVRDEAGPPPIPRERAAKQAPWEAIEATSWDLSSRKTTIPETITRPASPPAEVMPPVPPPAVSSPPPAPVARASSPPTIPLMLPAGLELAEVGLPTGGGRHGFRLPLTLKDPESGATTQVLLHMAITSRRTLNHQYVLVLGVALGCTLIGLAVLLARLLTSR